jgi:hypothetical protein
LKGHLSRVEEKKTNVIVWVRKNDGSEEIERGSQVGLRCLKQHEREELYYA